MNNKLPPQEQMVILPIGMDCSKARFCHEARYGTFNKHMKGGQLIRTPFQIYPDKGIK